MGKNMKMWEIGVSEETYKVFSSDQKRQQRFRDLIGFDIKTNDKITL